MTGELISIGVAFSWTATALLSEYGSKRMGNLTLNVLRMGFALLFSLVLFWAMTGNPLPASASSEAYGWMLLSGLVGYVIGDYCLFQCYIIIGSKFGQLFMTLAPITAAIMAGHRHHHSGAWRWSSSALAQAAAQWRAFCCWGSRLPRRRACVEQDWYGSLRGLNDCACGTMVAAFLCQLLSLRCWHCGLCGDDALQGNLCPVAAQCT